MFAFVIVIYHFHLYLFFSEISISEKIIKKISKFDLKNIKKYCVPILYYSFIVLLLTFVLFSNLMLFLTDSFDGTIFWLCVMFSSATNHLSMKF